MRARGTFSVQLAPLALVPGSGTDAPTGLAGVFSIGIEGGQHSYEFEYELP